MTGASHPGKGARDRTCINPVDKEQDLWNDHC